LTSYKSSLHLALKWDIPIIFCTLWLFSIHTFSSFCFFNVISFVMCACTCVLVRVEILWWHGEYW
jgi:hypothetical protein